MVYESNGYASASRIRGLLEGASRNNRPFYRSLAEKYGPLVVNWPYEQIVPIEYFCDEANIRAMVGVSSSSLISASSMLGIPAYTIAHWIGAWKFSDYQALADFAIKYLAPIEQMCGCGTGT